MGTPRQSRENVLWVEDGRMSTITPFLWYDSEAEQAAEFYVSLFENSSINEVSRSFDGTAFVVNFTLDGSRFQAMNAGKGHPFSDAVSFHIQADTQERIDELWDALTADGGAPSQCGWLIDRWGLSWQLVPSRLGELMSSTEPGVAQRVTAELMAMGKIDIAQLEAAAAG